MTLTKIERLLNEEIEDYHTLRKELFDAYSSEAEEDSQSLDDKGNPTYKKGDKIISVDSGNAKDYAKKVLELDRTEVTISIDATIPMSDLEIEYERKTTEDEVVNHKEPIITDWFLLEKLSNIIVS